MSIGDLMICATSCDGEQSCATVEIWCACGRKCLMSGNGEDGISLGRVMELDFCKECRK